MGDKDQHLEIAPKAPENSKEREKILTESDKKGAEITLGIREKRSADEIARESVEKEQEAAIGALAETRANEVETLNNIDPQKALREQPQARALLQPVTASLIAKLRNNGYEVPSLSSLPDPTKNPRIASKLELNATEVTALNQWITLRDASTPDAELEWKDFLQDTETDLRVTAALMNEDEKDPLHKQAWRYIKEEPIKAAILVAGGALGVWAIWKIAKGIAKSDFFKKGKLGKALEGAKFGLPTLSVLGGMFLLGASLGPEQWRRWIREKIGFNLTPKNIWQFITSGFDFDELKDGVVQIDQTSRDVAKEMQASAEHVAMMREIPYKEFMDIRTEGKTILKSQLPTVAEYFGMPAAAVEAMMDDGDVLDAEQELRKLLRSKKARLILEGKEPKTVGEALNMLEEGGYFEAAGATAANIGATAGALAASPETTPEGGVSLPESLQGQETWRWDQGSMERLQGIVGNKALGQFLSDTEMADLWSPIDWVKNLAEAAKQDGHALVSVNGVVGLVIEGYGWFAISSCAAVVNAFSDLWHMEFLEAGKGYTHDTLGFVMVLAGGRGAIHLIRKLLGKPAQTSLILEAARGAGEGLLMPATVAKYHAFAGQAIMRKGQETYLNWKIMANKDPNIVRSFKVKRLQHYADIYMRYAKAMENYEAEISMLEEGRFKRGITKGWTFLHKGRIERLRAKYAGNFIRLYNEMTTANSAGFKQLELEPTEATTAENQEALKKTIDEMRRHIRETGGLSEAQKTQITERTTQIREARAAGEGWEQFKNEKVNKMLRQRGLKPDTPEANRYMEAWDRAMAEQEIRGEPFNPNVEIDPTILEKTGAKARIERVKTVPEGEVFRYMEMEITIPEETLRKFPDKATDPAGYQEAAREYCSKKWRIPAAESAKVEFIEQGSQGKPSVYKINGKEIRVDFDPATSAEGGSTVEAAKSRYLDVLEKGGKVNPEVLAQIGYYAKFGWVRAIEGIIGTVGTAALIGMLILKEDKTEATAEAVSILATAMGGAMLFEKTAGKLSKNPAFHLFGNLVFGIAATVGLSHQLGEIMERGLRKLHLDGEKQAAIIAEITGLQMATRWLAPIAIKSAPKIAGKVGAQNVERFLMKKVQSKLITRVGKIAGSQAIKSILKKLGWRGAVSGILLLDDATLIGVIDDLVIVALIGWTAVDIVRLIGVIHESMKISDEAKKREGALLESIELPKDQEMALVEKLQAAGYEMGDIYEDGAININLLGSLSETQLYDLIGTCKVVMTYKGIEGSQVIELQEGEPVSIAYFDGGGELIGAMDETSVGKAEDLIAKAEGNLEAKGEDAPSADAEMSKAA